jgi:hypothetical protein
VCHVVHPQNYQNPHLSKVLTKAEMYYMTPTQEDYENDAIPTEDLGMFVLCSQADRRRFMDAIPATVSITIWTFDNLMEQM